MVVKTDTCYFSEYRIYPGHGRRVVRRDGKLLVFLNSRMRAHNNNRKKAMLLRWTQAWRRANKKLHVNKIVQKRVAKKSTRVFRAFSGISLEELQSRRAPNSDFKKSLRDAAERKKEVEATKSSKPAAATTAGASKRTKPKSTQSQMGFTKIPKKVRIQHQGMLR
uniref:Large ribosomal subunit protein eL24 n=1 Tax=Lygus hesperus TaxID=30085 RepID=A0A0A9WT15_LYGHE